jgi:hypothetical protein
VKFAAAERVADAVLYEGYALYPYRPSAAKNQFRWQFGVLAPRAPHDDDGEPWFAQTECLIDRGPGAIDTTLTVCVRCLRPGASGVESRAAHAWLEGVPRTIELEGIDLTGLPFSRAFSLDLSVAAVLTVEARQVDGSVKVDELVKLRLRLENHEPWQDEFAADRDAMLQRSLVGTHLLLAVEGGTFVSLLDPPQEAAGAAAGCENRHTWPVLVGDRGRRDLMLSSPIVLYDFPAVAKESPGDLCDAAEIDEILSLRIMTMTDEEKAEARETDSRVRALLDRVEAVGPDALSALHGTMRSADFFNPPGTPSPEQASVVVGGRCVEKGTHVTLRPNRRADAMDMFLRDRAATVAGVYRDVDDRIYVAVTVDDDPAAALHESFGRFFYFDPEELEVVRSADL